MASEGGDEARTADGFGWKPFAAIMLAFFMAHGANAMVVTPVQTYVMPQLATIASVIYLPHGVRVLSVWLYGWRAVPALFLGNLLALAVFSPVSMWELIEPRVLEAVLASSLCALLAFWVLERLRGTSVYGPGRVDVSSRTVLAAAAIASLLNAVSLTLIFDGLEGDAGRLALLLSYLMGDMVGTLLLLLTLMMIFRWIRLLKG